MLGLWKARRQQGDTLIEVLFAMSVFALIVVITLSIMNQGAATSQRSVEITAVRQQMAGQAEMLRFLHDAYIKAYVPGSAPAAGTFAAEYAQALSLGLVNASEFGSTDCGTPPKDSFIVHGDPTKTPAIELVSAATQSNLFEHPDTYAQVTTVGGTLKAQGMWIEAVKSATTPGNERYGYTDFHIRACWDAPGLDVPMNLGTIVRLYEPRD